MMTKVGIWAEFMMQKSIVIDYALRFSKDTLFLDSDTLLTGNIVVDNSKQIGVSPGYNSKASINKNGFYNGGMLWVSDKRVPERWRHYTTTSRFVDQASIEDLVKEFTYFEFGEEYNLQGWRFIVGKMSFDQHDAALVPSNGGLLYKDKPLKLIHTHFRDVKRFGKINDLLCRKLNLSRQYKELCIIYRIINDAWNITMPLQPRNSPYKHANDSFRELGIMWAKVHQDVVMTTNDSGHCWLQPTLLLYDRPTMKWISMNDEVSARASCALIGNGDVKKDCKDLLSHNIVCHPWIFWPRKPSITEEVMSSNIKSYIDRQVNVTFIGNIENSTQGAFRKNNDWAKHMDEYICTTGPGSKHKFSQKEYYDKLNNAKYGLCIRGFGSKCHREVELMAMGTVPIITDLVCIDSFMEPPVEGFHFLRIDKPENMTSLIKSIDKDTWTKMSQECYLWYMRNVHSSNSWLKTINYILYDC